jgi:ABC-type nitrate/sulfonate/bicarbonate transport system substrate-binding protein
MRLARYTPITLVIATTFALAACSGGASPSSSPSAPSASQSIEASSGAPSGSPSVVTLPKPEQAAISVTIGTTEAGLVPRYAVHSGLTKKYGLDVEALDIEGQNIMQALQAGQVDCAILSSAQIMGSWTTDSPVKVVYVDRDNLVDLLFTKSDIRTAEDLRGGTIGVSGLGAGSHAAAAAAIESLGLTTDDVTFLSVGNDVARTAALVGGSIDGAVVGEAQRAELLKAGFTLLVDLAKTDIKAGVPRVLACPVQFIEQNPNTVLALVASFVESNVRWREDPADAARLFSEWAQIPADEAKGLVDAFHAQPWRPLDGRCSLEVMDFVKGILATVEPAIADVKVADVCTNEFIDRLAELGLMHQIGVPGY